jgi:DNA mismatch endonuclease, patch repair protein
MAAIEQSGGMAGRSPAEVSRHMALIRKRDTKPELAVRRLVHRMGYRFRLHRRDLPGTPDLVFPARRKVILVHGCFWHRHDCSLGRKGPRARPEYWQPKFERNRQRDVATLEQLAALGWGALVIWECEMRTVSRESLEERLGAFLDGA